jgi:hypothetical protein
MGWDPKGVYALLPDVKRNQTSALKPKYEEMFDDKMGAVFALFPIMPWEKCFWIKQASGKETEGEDKHMYRGKEMEANHTRRVVAFHWHIDAHGQCSVCKQGLPVLLESTPASIFSG